MVVKKNSDPIRSFATWVTVFCLSGDVGASLLMAHSLEITISILNFMIHDDGVFLSCRAFFRRPLLCYCRRLVSDYASLSVSNQLIIICPRMQWRFRVLSFPSDIWFGEEICVFDPGIVGSRIDNEGKLILCFTQTPVHNTVSRQCQRIWWRLISLSLIFRIYYGNLLPCLSLSVRDFGRLPILSLRFWRWHSGTRLMRWYSSLHHYWTLTITKNDVIFCCWGHLKWKRCNRRSIVKLWKRIISYGEIVTEGVCGSTHEKCVDRHKSGTGTIREVGVFFFSEVVLVDAMKASVMYRWESIDISEPATRIDTVVHDSPVAFDVKTFTDVYGVKRTIERAYPGATSLFYVMWSFNARMPKRHTYHIRVRWILEEEYIMFYNMIACKAYRQEAASISLFQLCPLQYMAHKFAYVKVCFWEVLYGLNTVVLLII